MQFSFSKVYYSARVPQVLLGCIEYAKYLCFQIRGRQKRNEVVISQNVVLCRISKLLYSGNRQKILKTDRLQTSLSSNNYCKLKQHGSLYFGAKSSPSMDYIIMRFDQRSGEFHHIDIPSEFEDEIMFDHMQGKIIRLKQRNKWSKSCR